MLNLRELLGFNLLLQIFDGTASYLILSSGARELNPFISAAIDIWGVGWALIYWKALVCALLVLVYLLRRSQTTLPRRGLAFAAVVYSIIGVYHVLHLMMDSV